MQYAKLSHNSHASAQTSSSLRHHGDVGYTMMWSFSMSYVLILRKVRLLIIDCRAKRPALLLISTGVDTSRKNVWGI